MGHPLLGFLISKGGVRNLEVVICIILGVMGNERVVYLGCYVQRIKD